MDRVAALAHTLMFVINLAHRYGELGKLARTTGAWPSGRKAFGR
ncbi:MAG TPA: hypothetical protein VGL81_05790 [Polyangiaceae bacterium]|jgi:hypothetical protein